MSDVAGPLKDKIWFTFKARIVAHEMLVFKNNLTQILLIWYSFLTVTSSIVMIRYTSFFGKDGDIFLTGMSLFVLILSLVVSSRDYRGREKDMRANYLELQALYREIENSQNRDNSEEQLKVWDIRYQSVLERGENHRGYHDLAQRIRSASSLITRKPTKIEYVRYYLIFAVKTLIVIFMAALPVLLLVYLSYIE